MTPESQLSDLSLKVFQAVVSAAYLPVELLQPVGFVRQQMPARIPGPLVYKFLLIQQQAQEKLPRERL